MQKYVDYLISSNGGVPLTGVSVRINDAGTANAATIFSDDGVTSKANPFTNQSDGSFEFFAANGLYDLEFTLTGYTFDDSDTENITLYDPLDGLATGTATADRIAYYGTGGALSDNANLVFASSAGQLRLAVSGSSAGLLMGGDVLLYRSAANILTIADDVIIGDGQGLVIGHTAQVTTSTTTELQILGTGGADGRIIIGRWQANSSAPGIDLIKSRAAIGSFSSVSNNDNIGSIRFFPDDGVDYATEAASFHAAVDDADPEAGFVGAAFHWESMPGGNGNAIREVMALSAAAQLSLPISGSGAGILIGGDALWYRVSANLMRTPDSLTVDGNTILTGTTLMTGVTTHSDDVVSDTDSTDDLGTTGVRWANLWVDTITCGINATVGGTLSVTGDLTAITDLIVDDQLAVGGAVVTGAKMSIEFADVQRNIVTAVGHSLHIPADSMVINDGGADNATITLGAGVFIGTPTYTATAGTTTTVTVGASLYILGAPVGGTEVTVSTAYALWVDSGNVQIDDNLFVSGTTQFIGVTTHGDDVVSDTDSTDDLGTTSVRWANLWVDAITCTNAASISGLLTAAAGVSVTAGGILFPDTADDQADANNLDDYEEGNWTPVVALATGGGTVTYSTQVGRYTKIGRVVYINLQIVMSSLDGNSGAVTITGLPFTVGSASGAAAFGDFTNLAITAGYALIARFAEAGTKIDMFVADATTGTTVLLGAELSDDGAFIISGHYIV